MINIGHCVILGNLFRNRWRIIIKKTPTKIEFSKLFCFVFHALHSSTWWINIFVWNPDTISEPTQAIDSSKHWMIHENWTEPKKWLMAKSAKRATWMACMNECLWNLKWKLNSMFYVLMHSLSSISLAFFLRKNDDEKKTLEICSFETLFIPHVYIFKWLK